MHGVNCRRLDRGVHPEFECGWSLVERVPSGYSDMRLRTTGREGARCDGRTAESSGDSSSESPSPETSTRRLREQSQIEFEIDFLGRVLERDPFNVDALRVHGNNLAAKGLYAARPPDRSPARPTDPDDAIAWYNLACSYAVLGMIEPAFSALQRSLELGYRFLNRLRRDPDLKALRRDPRFARSSAAFRVPDLNDTSRMGARPGRPAAWLVCVGQVSPRSVWSSEPAWARLRAKSRPRRRSLTRKSLIFRGRPSRAIKDNWYVGQLAGQSVMAMEGRFHLYEGYSPCR